MSARVEWPVRLAAVALAIALVGFSSVAEAAERDHVLEWIAPPEVVDGYRVYLGIQSGDYDETLDLGPVSEDLDGISRMTLVLDADTAYFVSMTAYNAGGESGLSNEVVVAAESPACDPASCDDADPCTVDACVNDACANTTRPDFSSCGDGAEICLMGACELPECVTDCGLRER